LVLDKSTFSARNTHFGKAGKFAVQAGYFLVLGKSTFSAKNKHLVKRKNLPFKQLIFWF